MKSMCIDIHTFAEYIEGHLSSDEKDLAEIHFSECDRCRKILVNAYAIMNDSDLSDWEPASEQEVQSVLKHMGLSGRLEEVYKWIKEKLPGPPMQPAFAVIRDSSRLSSIEYIHFSRNINDLQANFYIEKTGDDKVSIRATVLKEDRKAQNTRLTFAREGGGPVSRPLKKDYEVFEDLPFGFYRFILKQNAIEKGTCLIYIREEEIRVDNDFS